MRTVTFRKHSINLNLLPGLWQDPTDYYYFLNSKYHNQSLLYLFIGNILTFFALEVFQEFTFIYEDESLSN